MASTPETRAIIRVLEEFHAIGSEITLPTILTFLYINERDGQSSNQYYATEKLSMTDATTSRSISHWAEFKRPRVAGHNMLVSTPDPEDRRYKRITLTRKGLDFIDKLKDAFNGSK